jgi:hypothetical protein
MELQQKLLNKRTVLLYKEAVLAMLMSKELLTQMKFKVS